MEVRKGSVWKHKTNGLLYEVVTVGANSNVFKRPVVFAGLRSWSQGCRPYKEFVEEFEWRHD